MTPSQAIVVATALILAAVRVGWPIGVYLVACVMDAFARRRAAKEADRG